MKIIGKINWEIINKYKERKKEMNIHRIRGGRKENES